MTDAKKKPDQPESPLARAMRTGTLGGAKPQEEPATTKVPDKIEDHFNKEGVERVA